MGMTETWLAISAGTMAFAIFAYIMSVRERRREEPDRIALEKAEIENWRLRQEVELLRRHLDLAQRPSTRP